MSAATIESSPSTKRLVVSAAGKKHHGEISIVIPVLNEALLIRSFLHNVRQRAPGAEIIVVDGGSVDGTAEIARPLCDSFLRTRPGRALQMNAGAEAATNNVLWFLHADVQIPPGCLGKIQDALRHDQVVGGFFRIRLPSREFIYRLTDSFAHYAGSLLRIRCGDHGIFCRRSAFFAAGAFPNVPLMEDVELFRALWKRGRMEAVATRLLANPRRYETIGPTRLTLAYGVIATLYVVGVPLRILAALYRQTCLRRD